MVEIQEDGCGSGCGLCGENVAGLLLLLVIVVVYLEGKSLHHFVGFNAMARFDHHLLIPLPQLTSNFFSPSSQSTLPHCGAPSIAGLSCLNLACNCALSSALFITSVCLLTFLS